jgi:hypothetical protein
MFSAWFITMARHHSFLLALLLIFLIGVTEAPDAGAAAAERPRRLEIWDLQLGVRIEQLPDEFIDYACGTNGGPPGLPLGGWHDFRRCRAEPSGLREVYFRYDDELEYWAKANDLQAQMEQYSGTKTYGFPVIVSVLVDAQGVVGGIRLVSDPRGDMQNREEAYFLRNFLTARFGRDNWQCEDLALADGETPVGGIFVKQRCTKRIDEHSQALLATRHLRKPGQSQFDPHSGRETTGQFESTARFELLRVREPPPSAAP